MWIDSRRAEEEILYLTYVTSGRRVSRVFDRATLLSLSLSFLHPYPLQRGSSFSFPPVTSILSPSLRSLYRCPWISPSVLLGRQSSPLSPSNPFPTPSLFLSAVNFLPRKKTENIDGCEIFFDENIKINLLLLFHDDILSLTFNPIFRIGTYLSKRFLFCFFMVLEEQLRLR